MIVYRLVRTKYARDLSGKGAELAGGRWNSAGIPVLYACESRALCVAEVVVHAPLGIIPEGYSMLTLEIPGRVPVLKIPEKELPEDWNTYPYPRGTQRMGDTFIKEGQNLLLSVPSAIVQGERNLLINPRHPEASQVKVLSEIPFQFDKRLFQR